MSLHSAILAILFLSSTAAAQSGNPVGMVLDPGESTRLIRNGQKGPVRLADLLYPGDKLEVENGAVELIFCPTSESIRAMSGSVLEVGDQSVRSAKETNVLRNSVKSCALPKVALGSESLERIGGLRARGNPPIPIFIGGDISTSQPFFEWAPIEGAEQYRVLLRDGTTGAVLWEKNAQKPELKYPDSGPVLEAKRYVWEVQALQQKQIIAQQSASFEVKPHAEQSDPLPETVPELLVLAGWYENSGYWAQAAACYRRIQKARGKDERLSRHLAWLYWNAGLFAATDHVMAK